MGSHIGWRGERNILYKGVETSLYQTCFKNLEGKPERKSPKRTISVSGGLGMLQMVSEPVIGRCVSEDVGPPREVDCEIPHLSEKGTKYYL